MIQSNSVSRLMTANSGWCEKTCYICGMHFIEGDSISLVIPTGDIKRKYKRLSGNAVVHTYELNILCNRVDSPEELYELLGAYKKPKKQQLSPEKSRLIELFTKAAFDCGFRDITKNAEGCKCKQYGSSDTIHYNVYSNKIRYSNNRKRGMFDFLAGEHMVATVYNKFHEYIGDGCVNTFNAAEEVHKIITEATNRVNNILK